MVDTGETDVSRTENTWKPGGSGRVGRSFCRHSGMLYLPETPFTEKRHKSTRSRMLRIPFLYSFGPGRTQSPFRLLVCYIFNDTNVVHYDGAILSLRYYPPDILEVIGINLIESETESWNIRCSFDTFINHRSSWIEFLSGYILMKIFALIFYRDIKQRAVRVLEKCPLKCMIRICYLFELKYFMLSRTCYRL